MLPRPMLRGPQRSWAVAIGFTIGLNLLIALAISSEGVMFTAATLLMVLAGVSFCYAVLPAGLLFGIELGSFIGVYTCGFVVLVEANFAPIGDLVQHVGYVLPMLAFFAGVWRHRRAISDLVAADDALEPAALAGMLGWAVPVMALVMLTFFVPALSLSPPGLDAVFLAIMLVVAIAAYAASPEVATFLTETGRLFEAFFARITRLLVPAFAFLTFYALQVIVFGCIYRLIGLNSAVMHFQLNGEAHRLSFAESLYFSVVTLATVGYGDIAPASDVARLIVGIQIVLGVLLMLFGVNEILNHAREQARSRRRQRAAPVSSDERDG